MKDRKSDGGNDPRRERQAKALRENLARRKAQSRARTRRTREAGEGPPREDDGDGSAA